MVRLLGRYGQAYASNQYRACSSSSSGWPRRSQFPDPMARLHPPNVTDQLMPVFTSGELSALERGWLRASAPRLAHLLTHMSMSGPTHRDGPGCRSPGRSVDCGELGQARGPGFAPRPDPRVTAHPQFRSMRNPATGQHQAVDRQDRGLQPCQHRIGASRRWLPDRTSPHRRQRHDCTDNLQHGGGATARMMPGLPVRPAVPACLRQYRAARSRPVPVHADGGVGQAQRTRSGRAAIPLRRAAAAWLPVPSARPRRVYPWPGLAGPGIAGLG